MKKLIQIYKEDEPKIFKSIARIVEYFLRASRYIKRYEIINNTDVIYRKEVTTLPPTQNNLKVLQVGNYDLQNKNLWTQNKIENLSLEKEKYLNVKLEVRISKEGEIKEVYLIPKQ